MSEQYVPNKEDVKEGGEPISKPEAYVPSEEEMKDAEGRMNLSESELSSQRETNMFPNAESSVENDRLMSQCDLHLLPNILLDRDNSGVAIGGTIGTHHVVFGKDIGGRIDGIRLTKEESSKLYEKFSNVRENQDHELAAIIEAKSHRSTDAGSEDIESYKSKVIQELLDL